MGLSYLFFRNSYFRCCLVSGEGTVMLGFCLCVSVCVCLLKRLHAALVLVVKIMRCIQCCLVFRDGP